MLKIQEAILVEGKYDKNTLSQVVDAVIFETSGFGIMKDDVRIAMLRRVAMSRGLIVFTDADGAGLVIRNKIKSLIPAAYLKHAYIPEIIGKERRKSTASKEGTLGVEGMTKEVLIASLRRAGATFCDAPTKLISCISKQDMFDLGLSGAKNSAQLRKKLLNMLDFPTNMSANAMLDALNLLYTKEEVFEFVQQIAD